MVEKTMTCHGLADQECKNKPTVELFTDDGFRIGHFCKKCAKRTMDEENDPDMKAAIAIMQLLGS